MESNHEDKPKGYWVFSVRVGTNKTGMKTQRMQEKIASKLLKIAGVFDIEVAEDYDKDPLKHLDGHIDDSLVRVPLNVAEKT